MSVPLGGAPIGTPVSSNLLVSTTIVCLGPFPVSPPFFTSSDALASSPMDLLPGLRAAPVLTMQATTLQGVHMGSILVALELESPHPSGGSACRGPPSVLRFVPAPPWWGVKYGPWTAGTTAVLCPMIPSSIILPVTPQYLPQSYLPSISFPPIAHSKRI